MTTGDPTGETGNAAHWATILGTYEDTEDYAIHYHWGKFRSCQLDSFATSNGQLTANMFVDFRKAEAVHPRTGLCRPSPPAP